MLSFLIFLVSFTSLNSREEALNSRYYKTIAIQGDGVYSLLRRYQLDNHSCNFDQFYRLNRLKKNAPLVVNQEYFLPILLYNFNGRTIRSSIGIDDWDLAVRIQNYNEQMLDIRLRPSSFKRDRVLWVPFHELNCPEADINIPDPISPQPEAMITPGRSRTFPIFGPKFQDTPLESNKLRNKVFYIVAGHGGPDPGAQGKRGNYTLCEDEYAYDVALRLCRKLVANGAIAYMVIRDPNDGIRTGDFLKCDTDEYNWGNTAIATGQRDRLFQRSNVVNALYKKHQLQGLADQKLVVVHVDSRSKKERIDLFFYYEPGNDESKSIAQRLQRTMKRKYKAAQKNRNYHGTVEKRDLHMLRETDPPGVYIELANIRNVFDQQRIILESNRIALSNWLYDGLVH